MADESFWTAEKEDILIDLWKAQPCLYDVTDREYSNSNNKAKAVEELSEILGIEAGRIQLWGKIYCFRAEQGLRDACSSGNRESLREIAEGLTVEKLDQVLSNGKEYPTGTPLFVAILYKQPAILRDLIQLGCDLEQECSLDLFFPVYFVDTGPALCVACDVGNVECVSILLKAGASVNHAGKCTTPLMSACQEGNPQIIDMLLEAGADVNMSPRDHSGQTALHVSCLAHDYVINIRFLIAYGGDVNAKDKAGHTPAFMACKGANCDVAELLLQHGDLASSAEEKTEMLWLLGAECMLRLVKPSLAIRYWKWACHTDANLSHYSHMLKTKLTVTQANAGIHRTLQSEADIAQMSGDPQRVQLQALVFLYLVFGWDKESVSCLTFLMSAALSEQKTWQTCQLLMFSEEMVDQMTFDDIGPVCVDINLMVEYLLELCLDPPSHSPQHLHVILQGFLGHILKLLQNIIPSPDLARKTILKQSHLQSAQQWSKKETAEQLIKGFLGVLKYGLSLEGNSVLGTSYTDQLKAFCQLCQLPSSVWAKLNCLVWKIAVHGGPCRKYSRVWQHHKLFPCVQTTKLLMLCGLDINCFDERKNTPLHNSLLCQAPSAEIVCTLVENGAEIDLPNKDGVRACDIIKKTPSYSLNLVKLSTLKSLAARTIVTHRLSFVKSLPQTLIEYVKVRHVNFPDQDVWGNKAQ